MYENDEFGPSESNFVWNVFQKSSRKDSNDVSKCEKSGVLPALLQLSLRYVEPLRVGTSFASIHFSAASVLAIL